MALKLTTHLRRLSGAGLLAASVLAAPATQAALTADSFGEGTGLRLGLLGGDLLNINTFGASVGLHDDQLRQNQVIGGPLLTGLVFLSPPTLTSSGMTDGDGSQGGNPYVMGEHVVEQLSLNVLNLLGPSLGLTATAITSTTRIEQIGNELDFGGESIFLDLDLEANQLLSTESETLDGTVSFDDNTQLINLLGIEVILNEVLCESGGMAIDCGTVSGGGLQDLKVTRNAVRVKLAPLGLNLADLIIAQSVAEASIDELAPVPLPAAAWLFLSGLGGMALAARRRRRA